MKQDFRLNKKGIEGTKEQGKLNWMSKPAECRAIKRGLNMTAISKLIGCDRKTLAKPACSAWSRNKEALVMRKLVLIPLLLLTASCASYYPYGGGYYAVPYAGYNYYQSPYYGNYGYRGSPFFGFGYGYRNYGGYRGGYPAYGWHRGYGGYRGGYGNGWRHGFGGSRGGFHGGFHR